jgi:hypothetical protein
MASILTIEYRIDNVDKVIRREISKLLLHQVLNPLILSRSLVGAIIDDYRNCLESSGAVELLECHHLQTLIYLVENWIQADIHAQISRLINRQRVRDQGFSDLVAREIHHRFEPLDEIERVCYGINRVLVTTASNLSWTNTPEFPEAEKKAKEKLRSLVSTEDYDNYILLGRLKYIAPDGTIYMIGSGEEMTDVYNPEYSHKLCVIFEDPNLPPTDSVIMRLMMLKTDPERFHSLAIKHPLAPPAPSNENVNREQYRGGLIPFLSTA